MDKGKLLIEALPYIKKFKGKTFVIKYGGSIFQDDELRKSFIKDVCLLNLVGIKVVLVHGGGKDIDICLSQIGKEKKFLNGYRVTDKESMEVVEMVLSGKINKHLSSMINIEGIKSIGISGRDNGLLRAETVNMNYGFVGKITSVKGEIITDMLDKGYLPVISPVGEDDFGNALNINGDTAAGEIAGALKAEKFILITDVDGLYGNYKYKESLISYIECNELEKMIEEKKLSGGMIPKIEACVSSLKSGVKSVHIVNGNIFHSVLLEVFLENGFGTMIWRDENE